MGLALQGLFHEAMLYCKLFQFLVPLEEILRIQCCRVSILIIFPWKCSLTAGPAAREPNPLIKNLKIYIPGFKALYKPLVNHGVYNLNKTCNIGTDNIISDLLVFCCSINT